LRDPDLLPQPHRRSDTVMWMWAVIAVGAVAWLLWHLWR